MVFIFLIFCVQDRTKTMDTLLKIIFIFYYQYIVEKARFWGQIFKMKVLEILHVLRSPESKKHIFSDLSVRMFVCISVCMVVCLLSL